MSNFMEIIEHGVFLGVTIHVVELGATLLLCGFEGKVLKEYNITFLYICGKKTPIVTCIIIMSILCNKICHIPVKYACLVNPIKKKDKITRLTQRVPYT